MKIKSANSTALISKIPFLFALLIFLSLLFIYLQDWLACLASPYSINFEGPMIWAADAIAQGKNIYPESGLKTEPWITTIYPPLYLVCCAGLVKLFGASYFYLRAASMVFAAGLACLFYRIGKSASLSASNILVGLVFYFSFEAVCIRSFEVRPDMMLVFFSVFMLERACAMEAKEVPSRRLFFQVLLLACVSICIKQQAIVFVLSLFFYWLIAGKYKIALSFLGLWLCFLLSFTGIMQAFFPAYLENLSFLSVVKSSSEVLISNLGSLGGDWIKIVPALILVPVGLLKAKKLEGIERLPFILVLISTVLFLYSMGIPASSASHMMSALFGLAWCLIILLKRLPDWSGMLLLLASTCSFPLIAQEGIYRPQLLPYAKASAAKLESYDFVGKPVLTDDVYLNMMTKSSPVFVDCATFLNVWAARASGSEELIDSIKKKRYAAVIINSNDSRLCHPPIWWPENVVRAIHANYKNTGELNCSGWPMDLYLPLGH